MKYLTRIAPLVLFFVSAAVVADGKTPGEKVDDTWIHTKVKAALVGYGSSNINVEVYNGVVQLAGFVGSDKAREKAENVAASVTGVKDVSDKLVVQTSVREAGQALDDGIVATKLKADLVEDDKTGAFHINVEVRHGVVLLSGFVESEAERSEALKLARGIDGVIKVIDGMDVVPLA